MVTFYNAEVRRFDAAHQGVEARVRDTLVSEFIDTDPTKISWAANEKRALARGKEFEFHPDRITLSAYRPFTKRWHFYDKIFNHSLYQLKRVFPSAEVENRLIICSGIGARSGFSVSMVDVHPNFDALEKGQCFPLRVYEVIEESDDGDLFGSGISSAPFTVRDGITDAGLKHFQDAYPGETITKEDLFYYVYGLLHSEDYLAKYADNLSKELPRIPRVKTAADFWAFSRAGRTLGDLHVNYETLEPYPVTIKQGDLRLADIKNPEAFYRVTKWAFGKTGREKDKTTVIYNANITMQDVPLEAYDYVVNGKPALEWVMERQVVKTDKASGIENDANRYAIETMGNPAYPLELFQRVITVSLRTMEIVRALPKLEVM